MGQLRSMLEKRKTLKSILQESDHDQQAGGARLKLFDLLCIGIGSTIGSGVFVLTGKALTVAGPGAVLAWVFAGIICLLSSSSYMELAARLPTKGSCYVFSYHGLGEVVSVIGAVCLTMEYGISSAGVARTWASKVYHIMDRWWVVCYNGATAPSPGCNADEDSYFDPLAALITVLCVVITAQGLDLGKIVINGFTVAKVCLVCFMIVGGFCCWTGNMFESTESFAPTGPSGVLSATSLLFFGFIGFDEVCCMSSKADNPSQTMPRALAGTLIGTAIISGTAQMALAAMVPYQVGMAGTPFEEAFAEHGWKVAKWLVHVGELVLLPLVVLLGILPQPEVTAAMSEDGLLPTVFSKQSARNGMYVRGTYVVGVLLTLIACAVPFTVLWDVISIGVLFSFNLTNASLINIRYGNGGELQSPCVDALVWVLMTLCGAAGYTLNLGVVDPMLAGELVDPLALGVGCVSGLGAVAIALAIYLRFEVKCAMDDPAIFKAVGVPFVQTAAIFCNFFLLSTLPLKSVGYFAIFLVAILLLYAAYVISRGGSRRKGVCNDESEESSDASSGDSGESD